MAFWLSGVVVALHLDNSTAVSLFILSRCYSIYSSFQASLAHLEYG